MLHIRPLSHCFKAIICDMDGLLADTETLCGRVRLAISQEHFGIKLTEEEIAECMGLSDQDFFERIFTAHQRTVDSKNATVLQKQEYDRLLATEAAFMPGAEAFVDRIQRTGLPLGLVSGSSRNEIEIVLGRLGISHLFPVVVSCHEISNRKPHPEGYLLAAQQMKVAPEHCLVFEDSPFGLQAAKNANMYCVYVQAHPKEQCIAAADAHVRNLSEILFVE